MTPHAHEDYKPNEGEALGEEDERRIKMSQDFMIPKFWMRDISVSHLLEESLKEMVEISCGGLMYPAI